MILEKAFLLAMLAGIATPFAIAGALWAADKVIRRFKEMLIEDAFNAVPSDARCDKCKHFRLSPDGKRTWCEVLARSVKVDRWCRDFEYSINEQIRQEAEKMRQREKSVESS